ncbi:hypothetical protein [Corynebacterium kefirresidentii]|uniref:hypothetical protein n=1 Tax=Corynebacterium kefirresidentii TaxID=1979527 RepID=UPI0013024404|nr:hypothetical protein [Corynebacterium kefirresidentii]
MYKPKVRKAQPLASTSGPTWGVVAGAYFYPLGNHTAALCAAQIATLHPRALAFLGLDRYWADRITLIRDQPANTLTHRGWL